MKTTHQQCKVCRLCQLQPSDLTRRTHRTWSSPKRRASIKSGEQVHFILSCPYIFLSFFFSPCPFYPLPSLLVFMCPTLRVFFLVCSLNCHICLCLSWRLFSLLESFYLPGRSTFLISWYFSLCLSSDLSHLSLSLLRLQLFFFSCNPVQFSDSLLSVLLSLPPPSLAPNLLTFNNIWSVSSENMVAASYGSFKLIIILMQSMHNNRTQAPSSLQSVERPEAKRSRFNRQEET